MNNESAGSQSLNSDGVTVKTMRDFLSDESKPVNLQQTDLLIVAYAALRKAEDHVIYDSHQTLASRLLCSIDSIERSMDRLAKLGYISRVHRKGRTTGFSLNIEAIPAEATLRNRISPQAEQLTRWYGNNLKSRKLRKRLDKYFQTRESQSAQRMIDACQGNENLAEALIEFALSDSRFTKVASKGLYHLRGRWRKLEAAYREDKSSAILSPSLQPFAGTDESVAPASSALAPVQTFTREELLAAVEKILKLDDRDRVWWGRVLMNLFERGYSVEEVRTKLREYRETYGETWMRAQGADAFSKLFTTPPEGEVKQ